MQCCSWLQVESTVAIQALQPRVKEIQERYKGRDPQEAQVHAHFNQHLTQSKPHSSPRRLCPASWRMSNT